MEIKEIYDKLIDKQLDLDKIMSLPTEDKKIIMDLYNQMHIDIYRFNIIYNTLTEHGYLVTRREKRLNDLID